MTRALVTGGAGFIGSHLCERLLSQGREVVVLDDMSSGSRENLGAVADRVTFIEDELASLPRYAAELDTVQEVYHLAALICGHDSLHQPDNYLDTNVHGTLRLLELCRSLEAPKVVFASSSTIYGDVADGRPRRETDLPAPTTVYALSKLVCEHLLEMYARLYGYEYATLRLFNVYGPRQSLSHPYANVTCKFAHAAATGGGITLYGDGEQSRDFVFVDDVVDAIVASSSMRLPNRTFNVGTGKDTSINGLLRVLSEIIGHDLPATREPPWPNDIRHIRADSTEARDDLGFEARVPLRAGLERTVDWFREHLREPNPVSTP